MRFLLVRANEPASSRGRMRGKAHMDCELQKLGHQVLRRSAMTRTGWIFAATGLLAVVSLLQPSATALGKTV